MERTTRVIAIRIPPALSDRLEAQARTENNKLGAVTRRLLTMALDREDAERASRDAARETR